MNHLKFKVKKLESPISWEKWRYLADIYIDGIGIDEWQTQYKLPPFLRSLNRADAEKAAGGYYGNKAKDLHHQLIVYHEKNYGYESREK